MKDCSFVVKLTNDCNLKCPYCYHLNNFNYTQNKKMGIDILEETIQCLIKNNNEFSHFIWHGGEPLLLGIDVFKQIVKFEKFYAKKTMKISNSIQTNGTLLNEEWIDFFYTNNFHVGISIDGFKELHITNRDINGQMFDSIMDNLKLLKKKKVSFGILTVVSKNTLGKEAELFDFYFASDIQNIGFLPNFLDINGIINEEISLLPKEYGQFLINYFEVWVRKGILGLSIREFDEFLRGYLGVNQRLCVHSNECDIYYTITPSGEIFPCDCFPQEAPLRLGTVFESLNSAHNNLCNILQKSTTMSQKCECCSYKKICGGGCKYYRWIESPSFNKPQYYCRSYFSLYKHIERYF